MIKELHAEPYQPKKGLARDKHGKIEWIFYLEM